MRGIAPKYIVTPKEVDYIPMLPEFDLEKCNGCGRCAAPGHCECIDKKAVLVKPKKCYS
jgi:MinD superfamily P-loop ATPase